MCEGQAAITPLIIIAINLPTVNVCLPALQKIARGAESGFENANTHVHIFILSPDVRALAYKEHLIHLCIYSLVVTSRHLSSSRTTLQQVNMLYGLHSSGRALGGGSPSDCQPVGGGRREVARVETRGWERQKDGRITKEGERLAIKGLPHKSH